MLKFKSNYPDLPFDRRIKGNRLHIFRKANESHYDSNIAFRFLFSASNKPGTFIGRINLVLSKTLT